MRKKISPKTKYNAALVAVAAMYAALLVGGKQILAVLPNVEIVTLLISVCAYVWGAAIVFPAVNVFIAVDIAIWGVNTWIISYLIHWNVVALCFCLLKRLNFRHRYAEVICVTAAGVVLTVLFGVLTSFIDVLVGYTGKGFFVHSVDLAKRFAVMYTSGVMYYATQTVCNAVLFATAFLPLVKLNVKAQMRLQPRDERDQSD